jgi:hypothetical protein
VRRAETWTVTLTMTVPDTHPGGSLLALRWIVLRIIDAIACAPFRVRVRVARADQAGRDDAR